MIKSHTTGRAVLVTFPDSENQVLFVEVDIDCPACGRQTFKFAGHHLRAIRNLCTEFVDLYPELVGEEAGLEVIKRMTFRGTSTPTPEDN